MLAQKHDSEDINRLKEELNTIKESAQNFGDRFAGIKEEFNSIQETVEKQKSKSRNFHNDYENFRNKKLYEVKIANREPFLFKLALYGEDILRLPFLAANIFNDKILYNSFVSSYNNLVLQKTLDNSEDFIDFLTKDPKFIDIYLYFTKKQRINIFSLFKENLGLNLFYFAVSESLRLAKDRAFGDRTLSFGDNVKIMQNSSMLRFMFGQPIKIYNLLELYLNTPKETNKFDVYSTNLVLKGFELLYSTGSFKKEKTSKVLKYYRNFLNSYGFVFLKEVLAFKKTLTFFDKTFYAKKRALYITKHKDEIMELLIKYEKLKTKYPKITKKNFSFFNDVENKIKEHITKAHTTTFKTWLRNKNAIYNSQKIIINSIASIPVYILIIKGLYNRYKGQTI